MKWMQKLAAVAGALGMGVAGMAATEAQAAPMGPSTAGATDGFVTLTSWGRQAT